METASISATLTLRSSDDEQPAKIKSDAAARANIVFLNKDIIISEKKIYLYYIVNRAEKQFEGKITFQDQACACSSWQEDLPGCSSQNQVRREVEIMVLVQDISFQNLP